MHHLMLVEAAGAERIKDYISMLPVIIPVLSGLRLAIFNIDKIQRESFKGLPTPANAIFIIGLIIASELFGQPDYRNSLLLEMGTFFFTLCFSVLMVTGYLCFLLRLSISI